MQPLGYWKQTQGVSVNHFHGVVIHYPITLFSNHKNGQNNLSQMAMWFTTNHAMKRHESQNVLTLITHQSNGKDITTSFIPSNTLAACTLSTKGEHTYIQPNPPRFSIVLFMWQHVKQPMSISPYSALFTLYKPWLMAIHITTSFLFCSFFMLNARIFNYFV